MPLVVVRIFVGGFKLFLRFVFWFKANLATLTYAISMGWPSASLPILQLPHGPLPTGPLTFAEASWTSSSICIGGAIGTIIYGWLVDFIGRKWSILSTSIFIIVSSVTWYLF